MSSNMARWMAANSITQQALGDFLGMSDASVNRRLAKISQWHEKDCIKLHKKFGLSADFVFDFIPYNTYMAQGKEQQK